MFYISKGFEQLDSTSLTLSEGGNCNFHDFAVAGVAGGAGNGFRMGIKTRTIKGAALGAIGGAIIGGVGYGATCWW